MIYAMYDGHIVDPTGLVGQTDPTDYEFFCATCKGRLTWVKPTSKRAYFKHSKYNRGCPTITNTKAKRAMKRAAHSLYVKLYPEFPENWIQLSETWAAEYLANAWGCKRTYQKENTMKLRSDEWKNEHKVSIYLRRVYGLGIVQANTMVMKHKDHVAIDDPQKAMHQIAYAEGLKS